MDIHVPRLLLAENFMKENNFRRTNALVDYDERIRDGFSFYKYQCLEKLVM